MTEEEAKTKWCPHAMEIGDGDVSYNRDYDGKPSRARCVGSRCMAWRFLQIPAGPPPYSVTKNSAFGYCGLAGKP